MPSQAARSSLRWPTRSGRHCAALDRPVARNGGPDLAYRKWTLPLC